MNYQTLQTNQKTLKAFGRAVIIGLGGTGQKALLQIKKNFQDNCGGKVPSSIRLLAFDTDQPEPALQDVHGKLVAFTANEFCRLRVNLVRKAIESPLVQDWWISYPPIDNTAITDGAGGVREIGRLALFSCIDQVKTRIETAYTEMKSYGSQERMESEGFALLEASDQVIVIGSLAGGTGGGTFYDMSILCHHLGKEGGEEGYKYMGYIMMPWVYRNLANTAYANTYAGLTELNTLAELSVQKPLRIRYSDTLEATLVESPFHIVNLVDGLCDNGERIAKAEDLTGFIAESAYHLTGALGSHARSVYDNIMALQRGLQPKDWKGCKAMFSAIGVANIRYPARELHMAKSCGLTAELLDLIREETIQASGRASAAATDDIATAFIAQHQLKPDKEALLKRLLPDGTVDHASIEDDLETVSTRQELVSIVEQRVKKAQQSAQATVVKNREDIGIEVMRKLREVLDKNSSKRDAALDMFSASFKAFTDQLAKLSQEAEEQAMVLRDRQERTENLLPAENSWRTLWSGFKSKARAFTEASNDHLDGVCAGFVISQAMRFIEDIVNALEAYRNEKGLIQAASDTLGDRLKASANALRVMANDYVPSKSMEKKRFEYILGVDDAAGSESPYYWYLENEPLPKAQELLRELRLKPDLLPAVASEIGVDKYVERLLDFTKSSCIGILSHSAVSVLAANKEKAVKENRADSTFELIQRALSKSVLLLPLRQEELVLEPKSVRDILVIGIGVSDTERQGRAQKIKENRQLLLNHVPQDMQDYTKIALTEEPYRITITRYKAIFPLHAIRGIEDLRRAYDESVLPPSHIDRKNLFVLSDPLPQDDTHHYAFKLLTLALMKCFEKTIDGKTYGGVLEHIKERHGGSYFKPAPDLADVCLQSYDDRGKLPGMPGKFYSLLDELARTQFEDLRAGIENALRERAKAPGFLPRFFAEAKAKEEECRAKVENVAQGLRREVLVLPGEDGERRVPGIFNKTVTGRYYRREADFFRRVLEKRAYIEKQVRDEHKKKSGAKSKTKVRDERKNLVALLFDPNEGFII